ncbi:hypothetical protein COO60DRAFT_1191601 [Scenedesmus sp. NREL 46B-D3]|nr:hypothetical protein COO60DRAFT_1191601 [Scenedesmus sp. NREL 46B-D3]
MRRLPSAGNSNQAAVPCRGSETQFLTQQAAPPWALDAGTTAAGAAVQASSQPGTAPLPSQQPGLALPAVPAVLVTGPAGAGSSRLMNVSSSAGGVSNSVAVGIEDLDADGLQLAAGTGNWARPGPCMHLPALPAAAAAVSPLLLLAALLHSIAALAQGHQQQQQQQPAWQRATPHQAAAAAFPGRSSSMPHCWTRAGPGRAPVVLVGAATQPTKGTSACCARRGWSLSCATGARWRAWLPTGSRRPTRRTWCGCCCCCRTWRAG